MLDECRSLNQYVPSSDVKAIATARDLDAVDDQTVHTRGAIVRLEPAGTRACTAHGQDAAGVAGDVEGGIITRRHDQGLATADL